MTPQANPANAFAVKLNDRGVKARVKLPCNMSSNRLGAGVTLTYPVTKSVGNLESLLLILAAIAQMVERLICNQDVRGSIPRGGTITKAP